MFLLPILFLGAATIVMYLLDNETTSYEKGCEQVNNLSL